MHHVCYRSMMGSETALKHINFLGICTGWATPSKRMGHQVGFWGACSTSMVPVLSPTARCPPPPPPPPPTPPPFPSLPCLSACPTCVNPSQAARRGGVSTAGGLWLPRPDYIGGSGGASRPVALSVLCAADWADTRRAGERARERRWLSQGHLARLPEILLGKQPRWRSRRRRQTTEKRADFIRDLQVSCLPSNPVHTSSWKHPTAETWALGRGCKIKGYEFEVNDSAHLLDVLLHLQVIDLFPAIHIRKIRIKEWNIFLLRQEFIILHLPGWVSQRGRQLITPDLRCWSPRTWPECIYRCIKFLSHLYGRAYHIYILTIRALRLQQFTPLYEYLK